VTDGRGGIKNYKKRVPGNGRTVPISRIADIAEVKNRKFHILSFFPLSFLPLSITSLTVNPSACDFNIRWKVALIKGRKRDRVQADSSNIFITQTSRRFSVFRELRTCE
jgi:hypothetical protein